MDNSRIALRIGFEDLALETKMENGLANST